MNHCIGIRREDKSIWERRVPLVPSDVRNLARDHGIPVVIQPSDIRAFDADEYDLAGATVSENLSDCSVVVAVKEIPKDLLLRDKTYVFFAHVIKGQPENMPMLQTILDRKCTLIDYEKVTDDSGRRLIFFGRHAGWAGMVDTLWAFGQRMKWEGIQSPFQALHPMRAYERLDRAMAALEVVGDWIRVEGLPPSIAPLVIGFAGYGNVSTGAQEILDPLPVTQIEPRDLPDLCRSPEASRHVIYKVVFKEEHLVEFRSVPGAFALQDYYDHPAKYAGVFRRYLSHLTILINAIYWTERYPRLVTKEDLSDLWSILDQSIAKPKLKVIGDISCDIDGAIEATVRSTDPGSPVFVYDPATGHTRDGFEGRGPVVMAVDILPSELPRESSTDFSRVLAQYVPALLSADYSQPFEQLHLPDAIKRAVIAHNGKLTPDFAHLAQYLEQPD